MEWEHLSKIIYKKHKLKLFRCKNLGNDNYFLESQLDIKCFEGTHNQYAFSFGLINFVGWGMICPLIILKVLSHYNKKSILQEK